MPSTSRIRSKPAGWPVSCCQMGKNAGASRFMRRPRAVPVFSAVCSKTRRLSGRSRVKHCAFVTLLRTPAKMRAEQQARVRDSSLLLTRPALVPGVERGVRTGISATSLSPDLSVLPHFWGSVSRSTQTVPAEERRMQQTSAKHLRRSSAWPIWVPAFGNSSRAEVVRITQSGIAPTHVAQCRARLYRLARLHEGRERRVPALEVVTV